MVEQPGVAGCLETLAQRAPHNKWRAPVMPSKKTDRPKRAEVREVSRAEMIARKLAKVAPDEDPAHVAGAIAIFATETIKRSANNLMEARAYLDGLKNGIDGLLKNAFADEVEKKQDE
jgi:stage V sporulation protein SpoVS